MIGKLDSEINMPPTRGFDYPYQETTPMPAATQFTDGQPVRYIGECPELVGKAGTFTTLRDHDLYCGAELGWCPGFIDSKSNGYFVELDEIEAI
jgi:hypothetical protein